jgi:hypothetical protein
MTALLGYTNTHNTQESNKFIRDHDHDRGAECDHGGQNDHDRDHDEQF